MTASEVPSVASCKNSLGKLKPKNSKTAMVSIIENAPIPIIELGNPNTSACLESITLLQLRVELMLQEGVYPASLRTLILSMVKMKEAIRPERLATSMVQAEVLFFNNTQKV